MILKGVSILIAGLLCMFTLASGCAEQIPPLAQITTDSAIATANESLSFSSTNSSDPDGTIVSYNWDFGDGEISTGVNTSHSYSTPGDYIVKLTVTDDDGLTNTAEFSIEIIPTIILLDVEASTWREGKEPYNIYGAIEEKLEEVGIEVSSDRSDYYCAVLLVDYTESMGSTYTYEDVLYGPTYRGTDIDCNMELLDQDSNLLLEIDISGNTPYRVDKNKLYSSALNNLKDEPFFVYLGDVIASRFGIFNTELEDKLLEELSDGDTQHDAIELLAAMRCNRAVEPFLSLLEDPNCNFHIIVMEGLGEIGDERAVAPLITILSSSPDDDIIEIPSGIVTPFREAAAKALGEIGGEEAVSALTIALDDEDTWVRTAARQALEHLGIAQ